MVLAARLSQNTTEETDAQGTTNHKRCTKLKSAPWKITHVSLNGVDLHYRTIGDGPVLFLVPPGWGGASGYLQRAFSSLASHFRLVFIVPE